MALMDEWRKGMHGDYRRSATEALDQTRQRESLTGRRSSPQERAAIVAGALRPHAQAYGDEYMRGMALQERSRQWDKGHKTRKKALKAQKKADEVRGIAEFAKLGIGAAGVGNQYYQNYQGGQTAQPGQQPVSYGASEDPSLFDSQYDPVWPENNWRNTGFSRKQIDAYQGYYGPGGAY